MVALALQTLHLICQDWLDLFPLNDIAQLKQTMSPTSRLLMILGNSAPSIIALSLALIFLDQPTPPGVGLYWAAYFGSVLVLMYSMGTSPISSALRRNSAENLCMPMAARIMYYRRAARIRVPIPST